MKPAAPIRATLPPLPRAPRCRVLLWIARRIYFLFLRLNGWRPQLLPSPLKGGGLVLKWCKTLGTVRHTCTTEEALQSESNLHLSHQRRRAHATTAN